MNARTDALGTKMGLQQGEDNVGKLSATISADEDNGTRLKA